MVGLSTSIYTSTQQEARLERGPVNRFLEKYKTYEQMAKKEAAEIKAATKHANAMSAHRGPMGNIIVQTRQYGTFALRPYDVQHGTTLLGETVIETRGRLPTDRVQTTIVGRNQK